MELRKKEKMAKHETAKEPATNSLSNLPLNIKYDREQPEDNQILCVSKQENEMETICKPSTSSDENSALQQPMIQGTTKTNSSFAEK